MTTSFHPALLAFLLIMEHCSSASSHSYESLRSLVQQEGHVLAQLKEGVSVIHGAVDISII